jgi:hypothetical protein
MLMTKKFQFRYQMHKDGPLKLTVLRKPSLTMENRLLDMYRIFRALDCEGVI